MAASSLIDTLASYRDRRMAALAALVLAGITAGAYAHAQQLLPPSPAFMPMFAGIMAFADLLTAYLLLSQGRTTGSARTLFLGALYLFCGLIIIPHLLTFPGVFDLALPAVAPDAAVWLWVFWHGAFGLGVALYCLWPEQEQTLKITPAAIAAAVLGVVVLVATATAVALFMPLPSLIQRGDYHVMDPLGITPLLVAFEAGAAVLAFIRLRGRTLLDLWLTVAIFDFLLDVVLTLHGTQRYSLGWYVARLNSMAASTVVLSAFLYQLSQLYNELVQQKAQLDEAHAQQRSLNRALTQLAQEDPLTGLFNRRGIQTLLEGEWRRWERYRRPFCVVMLDLDHFKSINDTHGHAVGDAVLQALGDLLRQNLRAADLASRYGGEEFLILMPETHAGGARQAAETLRARLAATPLTARQLAVTASFGIACAASYTDLAGLLHGADAACYRAKQSGRNRVVAAPLPAALGIGIPADEPAPR